MKVVLFDLGDTLVERFVTGYRVIEGGIDLLNYIKTLNNTNNRKLLWE
jgi:hypothetical protein